MQPALNATSYESIATVTVGAGGSSTITFSSIPSTYKHLQIRWIARASTSGENALKLSFNSDTTNGNYKSHYLEGSGSSAVAGAIAAANYAFCYAVAGSDASANVFGAGVVDILDYTNTNKNKTVRILGGYDSNGSGYMDFDSAVWLSTNAITSINIILDGSANFAQYSSLALYGIKGA